MAKQDTVESVIAAADKAGAPRKYQGQPPITATNGSGQTGKQALAPHTSPAAADPAASPYLVTPRAHVEVSDKDGAAYGIKATINKPNEPSLGPTLANARIIPAVINRTAPDFAGGASAGPPV
jgi:hypothetical protein